MNFDHAAARRMSGTRLTKGRPTVYTKVGHQEMIKNWRPATPLLYRTSRQGKSFPRETCQRKGAQEMILIDFISACQRLNIDDNFTKSKFKVVEKRIVKSGHFERLITSLVIKVFQQGQNGDSWFSFSVEKEMNTFSHIVNLLPRLESNSPQHNRKFRCSSTQDHCSIY